MAQRTDGKIPCIHALALAVFERSQILLAQSDFIIDNTLGERPARDAPPAPGSLFDCLSEAMQALNIVHDDYELLARHVVPSEQMLKEEAILRNQLSGPEPGKPIPVGRPG